MPGSSGNYKDEGVKSTEQNAVCTLIRQRQVVTKLWRFDWGTSDLEWYEDDNSEDGDVDEVQNQLPADDWSTQNVKDWVHCTRECEHWTVYFKLVKYNNGEANAMASHVSKAQSIVISDNIS